MEDLIRLLISSNRLKSLTDKNLKLTDKESHYINKVMRLKNGQEIQVRSVEKISNLKLNDEVLLNWNKTDLLLHTK